MLVAGIVGAYFFFSSQNTESAQQPAPVAQTEVEKPAAPVAESEPSTDDGPYFAGDVGIWSWTSSQEVTYGDLYGMNSDELRLMRNEIFARHGYIFKSSDLRSYFGRQSWYRPITSSTSELGLSPLEKKNVETIRNYEKYYAS